MAEANDQWTFFVDEALIEKLMGGKPDEPAPEAPQRPAASAALGRIVALAREGKAREALSAVAESLAAGDDSLELLAARGHLEFEVGEFEQAERSYAEVARRAPDLLTAHYNRALTLEKLGRFAEAAEIFEIAAGIDPGRWQTRLGWGVCELQQGHAEAALEQFEKCLVASAGNAQAMFGKAAALQALGRLEQAGDLYRAMIAQQLESPALLSNVIAISTARKEESRMREYSERLLKLEPQARAALEGLATAALWRGDYNSAVNYCAQLVKVAADSFEAWFNLGVAYQKSGRLDQASQAYQEAARLRPDSEQAHANLGSVLQERGDLPGAKRAYDRALELNSAIPGVLWNLGLLAERQNQGDEAEKYFTRLASGPGEWEEAHFRLGCLWLNREDWVQAVEAFEACLKKRRDWPEAEINLGIAYWKFGDLETAEEHLNRGLAGQAGSLPALRALTQIAIENKDVPRARELHQKLTRANDRTPELAYNLGLLLQETGQPEEAAVCYELALAERPDLFPAMLNLGHALAALGREQEAKEYWSKALESRPELAAGYFPSN